MNMNTSAIKKLLLPFIFLFLLAMQAGASVTNVVNLRTNNLTNPLGIDMTPFFSWQITSDARGQSQSAYQILVASSQALLDANTGDIWDSGNIKSSASNNISYAGDPLKSKTDYYWKVCVRDQDGVQSNWSQSARFGMAMLQTSDWTANWITYKANARNYTHVDIVFDEPVLARYIRLDVTKIGIPVDENNLWRLQLAEMQVFGPLDTLANVALNHTVTITNEFIYGPWLSSYLTDGILTSTSTSSGATTNTYTSGVLTTPVYVQIDLGSEMMVNKVVLYPRNDVSSKANSALVGSFPQDYSVETKITDGTVFTVRKTIVNQATPALVKTNVSLPMFGKNFQITKEIKTAKMYACGLGLFDLKVNGKAVTTNLMEPGETNYNLTDLYATYDVKNLLVVGQNTMISTLGNALYNNPSGSGRYQKISSVYGSLKFIGQLEIVYTDGTSQTIITDDSWKNSQCPITYSSWYGGEDYDARLEQANINQSGFTIPSTWGNAALCTESAGTLKAQFYPATIVMDSWKAVKITNPATGIYVVDFGRNFAGQYEFSMKAPAGASVQFWPSELLDGSGRANQSATGTPVYDTYTFKGDTIETWGPKFVYHGFRYLEIRGLTTAPTADMFTAKLIRSGLDKIGKFSTSNSILNQTDVILTRSIEANLYNTFTDCPGREKLGWLEVPNLLYNSVSPGYDLSAWMSKITMDTKNSQLPNGMVPTTAPEHSVFADPYRDDPTWDGAAITVPWQNYVTYGDFNQLKNAYPVMTKLMNYFATRASGYLLNYGLGEWGAVDVSTTVGFTVSCTYYHLATVMSLVAQTLGIAADSTKFATLATNIRNAINTTYYKSATGSYDSGSQASNAMAVFYGIVQDNNKSTVLKNLVTKVQNAGYHLSTGEIALKPLFLSLAENGYNDVVYTMATQTTQPSYGYFVLSGCTTTPEYWDLSGSQNHCMMGHIESWFYEHLGGIKNSDIAFHKFIVEPCFPTGLDSVHVETASMYGKIRSVWNRNSNTINHLVEVPVNSTATIHLLRTDLTGITENGIPLAVGNGINSFIVNNGEVEVEVGSGIYNFSYSLQTTVSVIDLQALIASANTNIITNVTSGWSGLQTALVEANTVVANTSVTQQQVDQAKADLTTAMQNLVFVNIALNKTPIASSAYSQWGWALTNLTDGDLVNGGTGYCSDMSNITIQHTEWAGVNFGFSYNISSVDFYPRSLTTNGVFTGGQSFPVDFDIQVSNDGINWTTVQSINNYPAPTAPTAQHFAFTTVKAQYVRMNATKLRAFTDGDYYLQLAEMEVH